MQILTFIEPDVLSDAFISAESKKKSKLLVQKPVNLNSTPFSKNIKFYAKLRYDEIYDTRLGVEELTIIKSY